MDQTSGYRLAAMEASNGPVRERGSSTGRACGSARADHWARLDRAGPWAAVGTGALWGLPSGPGFLGGPGSGGGRPPQRGRHQRRDCRPSGGQPRRATGDSVPRRSLRGASAPSVPARSPLLSRHRARRARVGARKTPNAFVALPNHRGRPLIAHFLIVMSSFASVTCTPRSRRTSDRRTGRPRGMKND